MLRLAGVVLAWLLQAVAGDSDVVTTVIPGQPLTSSVQPHDYRYFELVPDSLNRGKALTIAVTPLWGDPDLVVSTTVKKPTQATNTWSRAHLGADTISISAEDPHACGNTAGCTYHIGVFGFAGSTFTLLVSYQNSTPTTLTLGQPQQDSVAGGGVRQYALNITPEIMFHDGLITDLQVVVSAIVGDADLYTTLDGTSPSSSHWNYRSASWGEVDDRVVIHRNDSHYQRHCKEDRCILRAAVYGFHRADYSIVVSTSTEATILQPGHALQSTTAPGIYQPYAVHWESAASDVVLTLTAQSGQPRLYVSCGESFPNVTHSDYHLDTGVSRSSFVRVEAGKYPQCKPPTKLTMTVYGDTLCSYSLLASTDASTSVPLLIPGLQLAGFAKAKTFAYYQLRLGNEYVDLEVILSMRSGEADLYVSTTYEGRPQYDAAAHRVVNYTQSSSHTGDDRLSIKHSHMGECVVESGCVYVIGVFARGGDSHFTIVGKKVDSTITLTDGAAVRDVVGPRNYEYFRIKVVDPKADLSVAVTALSGDPDLYCSPSPYPTKENYTWAARGFGSDTLVLQAEDMKKHCTPKPYEGQGCDYWIGVYGWVNTTFSLMASLSTGWKQPMALTMGQPQTGRVDKGGYQYYMLYLSSSDTQSSTISITLAPHDTDSDQDLYVTLSPSREAAREPGKTQYDLKSTSWNSMDEVAIAPSSEHYCHDCYVFVAVYGYGGGSFTLLAFTSTESTMLAIGSPVHGSVQGDSYAYFSADWVESAVDDFVLDVTPDSCRPKAYASCTVALPNATSHDWALDTRFAHQLRLRSSGALRHGCHSPGKLYISVFSEHTSCSYTIMTSSDASSSVPRLSPGVQLSGSVTKHKMQYYQIRTGSEYPNMDVILSVRSGEADLYVSKSWTARPQYDPFQGVYNYSLGSVNNGDDRVNIKKSVMGQCETPGACYYVIAVFGRGRLNSYNIVAKKRDSTINLRDGSAVRDTVGARAYEYFKFRVTNPSQDLSIAVTPFSGDADVYVSPHTNHNPTKDNYTWASRGFGADHLMIQSREMEEQCLPDPEAAKACVYYIGVYGWTNSSFSILASLNSGWESPMVLSSGSPQTSSIQQGEYEYHELWVEDVDEGDPLPVITITLTPTEGTDQDLFVVVDSDDDEDTREPGKNEYDYKSTAWGDIDEVVIRPGDHKYCTGCSIYAAVWGYQAGRYSILATLSTEATDMQLDVPLQASVPADTMALYTLPSWPSFPSTDLVISVTPESGRPTVYASCRERRPNATTPHTWTLATRSGQSLLHITAAQAQEAGCSSAVVVHVAVEGDTHMSAHYTLLASIGANSSVPVLVPGVQVSGSVGNHNFAYYQVTLSKEYADMTIIATVRYGEVDLYVSTSWAGRPQYSPTRGVFNYTLASATEGSDRLSIQQSRMGDCSGQNGCTYVVGVFGRGHGHTKNEFTLVAKKQSSVVTLQDGVPLRDSVAAHSYQYFRTSVVDPSVDVSIAVTPYSGDPDLYADLQPNTRPSKENHTWAARGFGADTLTIQAADLKSHCTPDPVRGVACELYIGVYGWSNASFSIMAKIGRGWDSPIVLLPGQPQSGHVFKQTYQYYSYAVQEGTDRVRFVLSSAGDTDQDLYLSVSHDKEPGRTQYDLKSTSWAGTDEISFSRADAPHVFCTGCVVYLAVYGYLEGDYTVSVDAGIILLQNAVPVTGHVSTSGFQYYKVLNTNPSAHVVVSVSTLSGDPDLFMARSPTLPLRDNYIWRANRVGDDKVDVLPSDAKYCSSCEYTVGVWGWTNSSYVITAAVEDMYIIPLAAGRPHSDHALRGQLRYFSIGLGNSAESLRISLTLLSGAAELYVADPLDRNNLPDPSKPGTYKYSSRQTGRPEVVIAGPHANRTTFAIGVYGVEDAEFSVMAALSQAPVMLQEGVAVQQSTSAGRTEFFVYRIANEGDVTVTVTAIKGDPDVLASTTNERPQCVQTEGSTSVFSYECVNYTWISQSFASDTVTILQDVPCQENGNTRVDQSCKAEQFRPGKDLYIGVYGYQDTVYTIAVTTSGGHTSLVPGRPQHASTHAGVVCAKRTPTGSCDTSAAAGHSTWYEAQVAYFSFRVSPTDIGASGQNAYVSVAVKPSCNTTLSPCAPGCPCNPLNVYVKSCAESACTEDDQHPSSFPGHHHVSHTVDSAHSTLFIAHDPLNPGNGYCDGTERGEVCYYWVAVLSKEREDRSAAFTITAATPRDVTVVPARTHPAPPDGIVTTSLDTVDGGEGKKYQLYTDVWSNLVLSVEPCTGHVGLKVCDGSCTSGLWPAEDFTWYADTTQTCTASSCVPSTAAVPVVTVKDVQADALFIAVNGSGTFHFKLEATGPEHGGGSVAPILAPPGATQTPEVTDVQADRVTLSWQPVELSLGGPSKTSVHPQRVRYKVFAINEKALADARSRETGNMRPVVDTPCGLEHYSAVSSFEGGSKMAITDEGQTSLTLSGLTPGTAYRFVVLGLCNGECLRHISKVTSPQILAIPCGTSAPCRDQSAVFSPAYVSTLATMSDTSDRGGPSSAHKKAAPTLIVVLLIVLVMAGGGMAFMYRRSRRIEQQLAYEMTDASSHIPTISSRAGAGATRAAPVLGGRRYDPLLQDEETDLDDSGTLSRSEIQHMV